VQKYVSMTNHMWDGFWMLSNRRSWGAMPDDLKEIVARNFDASAVEQRADIEKLNTSLQGELEANGMVFNTPETAAFQQKLVDAGFYKEWKDKFGDDAWAILEKATGLTLG
jgi:TRAP-type C4-dicarboxylate transport system substrate-binding protein